MPRPKTKQPKTKKEASPAEAATSETVIRLSGNLRIEQAADGQQELLAALQANERIILELQEVEQLDLSFMQLLLATRKSAQQLGKEFVIKAELGDEVAVLLKHAGLQSWLSNEHEETNQL